MSRPPWPPVRQPLVAVSGIDGAGKSTLVASLLERLGSRGWEQLPKFTAYLPGSMAAVLGDGLPADVSPAVVMEGRRATMYRVAHVMEFVTYVASSPVRGPLGRAGPGLIADRWTLDFWAWARTAPSHEWTDELAAAVPAPDVTIVVDVPAEVAVARIAARGRTHALDTLEVLGPFRTAMLATAAEYPGRVEVVDGTLAEDALVEIAYGVVQESVRLSGGAPAQPG